MKVSAQQLAEILSSVECTAVSNPTIELAFMDVAADQKRRNNGSTIPIEEDVLHFRICGLKKSIRVKETIPRYLPKILAAINAKKFPPHALEEFLNEVSSLEINDSGLLVCRSSESRPDEDEESAY